MKGQVNLIKELVREEIRKKNGHQIRVARDCQILSESILETTGRQISVSTLKRFFGIIKTPFKPSKYTLDTLAIYLDFKNWEDYANSFEDAKHVYSNLNSWEQLKRRALYITGSSMQTIGSKMNKEVTSMPPRDFAVRKTTAFLHSHKIATAFIAPGGYGKSSLIYQLTEYYFTGENAKSPNDIVMLLDGGSLVSLLNKFEDFSWLHNLLDFNPKNSFSSYFRNNPDKVKGHFVLIIDALNEIFYQTEKLAGFIENLLDIVASYEDIPWFKLIVTCQPDNWRILSCTAKKKPAIKKLWFDVSFNALPAETINVPLLEKREIKQTLDRKYPKHFYNQLRFHSPQTAEMIAHPYFLSLFMQEDEKTVTTEIDLLNKFLSDNVLSEPFPVEKSKIIDVILQHSEYGKKITPVNKEDLPHSAEYSIAYKDLISRNIIYEMTIPCSYLSVSTVVRFSHDILMEFMLANKWLRENKFDLALIHKIIEYYSENEQLRFTLIKYMIKIAFKERKTDLLKDIYSIFSKTHDNKILIERADADPEILNIINMELRQHREMRDYLIPHYAKSRSGQQFYFETFFDMDSLVLHAGDNVNYYLKNNPDEDAQIYGHYLKFTQYFLIRDIEKQKKEYLWFKKIKKPERLVPLTAGFYYTALISFSSTVEDETWKKLLQQSERYFDQGSQESYNFPIFEYLVINSLNYSNCFEKVRELTKLVTERYVLSNHKSSWLYQIMMAFYARALLNTGAPEIGSEILKKVELKSISPNYNYYAKLRFYLIRAEFMQYENKIEEALELLEEVKATARMLRFKYFYDQASSFEQKLKADDSGTPPGQKRKNLKAL